MKKPFYDIWQRQDIHNNSLLGAKLKVLLEWEKLKRELRKEYHFLLAEYIIYKLGKIKLINGNN